MGVIIHESVDHLSERGSGQVALLSGSLEIGEDILLGRVFGLKFGRGEKVLQVAGVGLDGCLAIIFQAQVCAQGVDCRRWRVVDIIEFFVEDIPALEGERD